MKFFGIELKFNNFDIWHRGNFNPADKQDTLGYDPLDKTGDIMHGKLNLQAGTASEAPLNIPHGTAPTSPVNGDLWTTTSAPMMRINGTTRTLYHNGNASTAALTTATQAEAEAGTSTTVRGWTAQRIRQAIHAILPTKLSQLENDIGAGGGIVITTSPTAPSSPSPGDFWYKEE